MGFELESYDAYGEAVISVIDGFKQYPSVVLKILSRHGMIQKNDETIDKGSWYPLDRWIASLNSIVEEIGANSVYMVGKNIPDTSVWPPHIKDIHSALSSVEIAYHMNHRTKAGVVMFDPATGIIMDGIGTYKYIATRASVRSASIARIPILCYFDRGIVTAISARWEPNARATHDPGAAARRAARAAPTSSAGDRPAAGHPVTSDHD